MDPKPNHGRLFYEGRPAIYLILGLLCLVFGFKNWVIMACGGVLIFCGVYVSKIRKKYRGSKY